MNEESAPLEVQGDSCDPVSSVNPYIFEDLHYRLMKYRWYRALARFGNRLKYCVVLKPESNYIAFAKRELEALGYDLYDTEEGPNKWIQENVLELLEVFAAQGHSGFSAPYCIELFSKLASWQPVAPLTGDDSEWTQVCPDMWQNKRCGHVFKDEDGRAYDINGKIFREPDGCCYTSRDSRVYITFPYTPKTEYVDVEREND